MWRKLEKFVTENEVHEFRTEAETLLAEDCDLEESGCVVETLREGRGNDWRTDIDSYINQRKIRPSKHMKACIFEKFARCASEELIADTVWLFNEQYLVKPAESEISFRWHRDREEQLSAVLDQDLKATPYLSCWLALDDCDEENGCLEVDAGPIACKAGDLIILHADCWHRSGPNRSKRNRRAYYLQFSKAAIIDKHGPLRLALQCPSLSLLDIYLEELNKEEPLAANDIDTIRSRCWQALHTNKDWRAVNPLYRRAYAWTALCKMKENISEAEKYKILDLALMMTDETHRKDLHRAVAELDVTSHFKKRTLQTEFCILQTSIFQRQLSGSIPLTVYRSPPSVSSFGQIHFYPRTSAHIKNAISKWPAFHVWSDLNYLLTIAGHRIIPIERGEHYLDPAFTEELMTLSDFIHTFILQNDPTAYLAQHALFDQIPKLRLDLGLPDYCSAFSDSEIEALPRLNAWFGAGGTKSPLHHDRYHNLLVQVFGSKYIRLYAPDQTALLYPRSDAIHSVSSQISDIDDYDTTSFPRFTDAVYQDCILEAGDMLYIPPGTWHYIESRSVSFSVSFWWL